MSQSQSQAAFPYLIQGKNIVVVIDGVSYTVSTGDISYNKIKDAIKASDWGTARDLVDPKQVVLQYGKGNIGVQGSKLFWKGREFHNYLASKFIEMYQEGFPVEPMVNFMENLMSNPSHRAVNELYGFLEKGNLPITSDGCFLAYKKVENNYLDIHSGTVLNKPAQFMDSEDAKFLAESTGKNGEVTVEVQDGVTVISMERNAVDDDKDRTCSSGLHFCSIDYLANFGGADSRTVILKINPRDVVSIPSDYHATKGRTCRYEVIDEINKDAADAFVAPVQDSVVVDGVDAETIRIAVEAAVKAALEAKAASGN
jgi:hypothetical protein